MMPVSASHLMGGSLTYQFLSLDTSTNIVHYRVKLQLFRDCTSGVPLADPIDLGIYTQDTANPNANKTLYTIFSLQQDSLQIVNPPTPGDSCGFTTPVCVQEGDYHSDIFVPSNPGGYHLIVQLNARNAAVTNLNNPGNLGQTYYAFIPPSSVQNQSPVFADIPVPFICIDDTISIVNLATDGDGDSLSYAFVVPYDSYTHMNPTPSPPGTINVPPPIVPYDAPTYSFAQPFGAGGIATIDPVSGLTYYYIPDIGFYVVCVQINEYRNGVLIASTRRDLQLIAIACPFNPPPVLSNIGGSGITVYNITEGATLCFPITMSDQLGDSVFVHGSGSLFDSTQVNPNATFSDATGAGSATSQFCWTTVCGQNRTAPYQFTVSATDNGCPPKVANVVYSIYVHPFTGPISINGPDSLCNTATGTAYNVSSASGSTYFWSVTNGTQSSGGNSSSITIDWNNNTSGSVSVYAVSQFGCLSDTISKTVILKPLSVADAGGDVTFCSGQNAIIGSTSQPGYVYSWNPTLGLSNIVASQPTVTINNGLTSPATYPYIMTTNLNGCYDYDTTQVTVRPLPVSNAGVDGSFCSGDTVHLGTLSTTGYTYSWTPSTGLSSTTVSNPDIVVSNATTAPIILVFHVTTTLDNCVTQDSVLLIVNQLPVVSATTTPDTICEGEIATLRAFGASVYSWANLLSPGTPIGAGNVLNVSPTVTTTYIVTGTSSANCVNKDTLTLIESPLPNVQAVAFPDSVCEGSTSTITVSGAVNYWWATLASPNDTVGTGPSLPVTPDSSLSFIVTGINSFGCINKDTLRLTMNPAPTVDSVYGNQSICPGVTGVGYIALPYTSTSTYQWIIQSGNIGSGQGMDTVYVGWDSISGPGYISVVEITNYQCASDTITLPVNINVLLSPIAPWGITPLCEENADSSVYSTFNTPGSVYTWGVLNGHIVNGDGTNVITIDWDSTGIDKGLLWYSEHSITVDTFCNGISDTLLVTIHARPVTSTISGTFGLCAFDSENIYSVVQNSGSSYLWTVSGGSIVQGNGSNSIHVNWGQAGTETLAVTETNLTGCTGLRVDTTIIIYTVPQSMFNATFEPTCAGLEASLVDASVNGSSSVWLFGDGTQLADTNIFPSEIVTHIYPYGSTSQISLITTNYICSDTMQLQVPPIGLEDALDSLPNVFTPNGDGINDCFRISPEGGLNDCAVLTIFNRWGHLVFEGDTKNRCWNGKTTSGTDCNEGIYFYTLQVANTAKNGFVELIRK